VPIRARTAALSGERMSRRPSLALTERRRGRLDEYISDRCGGARAIPKACALFGDRATLEGWVLFFVQVQGSVGIRVRVAAESSLADAAFQTENLERTET